MTFTLLHADAIEAMQAMAENSVDAIVTDPPYGLEFMGKEWDRLGDVRQPGDETFTDVDNPYGRSKVRYGYDVPLAAMQEWHHAWATEALRILKPGGHLLAFGGTRTYHRLACAIEDAGFEIRDCLAWMYGSGFPKSLDVSKAIDKANGDAGRVLRFTAWMRTTGLTARQIDEATGTNMGGHYLTAAAQPAIPTAALWAVLRPMCGDVPGWVDELVERIEAEREVLGTRTDVATRIYDGGMGPRMPDTINVTAPATPEAQRWNGWGTALKPAFEPIVLARKPMMYRTVALNVQHWGTGALNIDGCRIEGEPWVAHRATGLASTKFFTEGDTPEIDKEPHEGGRWPPNVTLDETAAAMLDEQTGELTSALRSGYSTPNPNEVYGDLGRSPTNPANTYGDTGGASRFFYCPKADREERNRGLGHMPAAVRDNAVSRADQDNEHARRPNRTPVGNHHPTVKPVELMRWLCRMVTPKGGTVLDPFAGSGSTGVAAMREGFEFIGIEREADYVEIARSRIYGDAPMFNVEVGGGPTE